MKQNKALVIERPVGRPKRLSVDENQDPRWQRRPVVHTPCKTVREDFMSHWPSFAVKKNNCWHCKTGIIRMMCMKCNVHLCLTSSRNCFYDFHH